MISKIAKVGLVLALAAMMSSCQPDRPDIAQDLIDAFSAGCSSHGFWTDSALSHTNSLVNVLMKIKTTGPCQALNGNLTQIQSMNNQLSVLLQSSSDPSNPNSYASYRYNEENIQELVLALKQPGLDPALQASLTSTLAQAQAQQTTLRSRYFVDKFSSATSQMGTTMQSLVQQAGDLSYCFNESPAVGLKLATNALAVAGSFISPVVGAGVATLGSLMNGAIDYVRFHSTNKALWELYSAKMPLALTCGLEAMANLYCQASDSVELIEFQKANYPSNGQLPSVAWTGMDILNRRLPVLTKWLLQVKTGVSPNDSTEAQKQIAIWQKIQNIENTDISVVGGIHGALQIYSGATNDTDRLNLTVNTIVTFANGMVPQCPGCTGPLAGLSSQLNYYACWLVDGYRDVSRGNDARCPIYNPQVDPTIEGYVRRVLAGHSDIKTFEDHWKQIFLAAKSLADIEFSQTITLNPAELLRQSYAHDADNISAHEVLIMLRDYVTTLLTTLDDRNPNDRPVMVDTLAAINDSLAIIENRYSKETGAVGRVRALIDTLDLKHSARAFLQLVTEVVTTDVQKRIDQGELPREISDILRSSGGDVRARLQSAGIDNLGPVLADINGSRSLTENNIVVFRKYFGPSFVKAIAALFAAAHPKDATGEPDTGVDRPHSQTLAKLCMLLISTGYDWPDKKTGEICRKQNLSSLYSDPNKSQKNSNDPLTVHIGELETRLKGKRLQDRFCTYHKFSRAERLAEVLERLQRRPRPQLWQDDWTLDLLVN